MECSWCSRSVPSTLAMLSRSESRHRAVPYASLANFAPSVTSRRRSPLDPAHDPLLVKPIEAYVRSPCWRHPRGDPDGGWRRAGRSARSRPLRRRPWRGTDAGDLVLHLVVGILELLHRRQRVGHPPRRPRPEVQSLEVEGGIVFPCGSVCGESVWASRAAWRSAFVECSKRSADKWT